MIDAQARQHLYRRFTTLEKLGLFEPAHKRVGLPKEIEPITTTERERERVNTSSIVRRIDQSIHTPWMQGNAWAS